jgi:hypothetical protein
MVTGRRLAGSPALCVLVLAVAVLSGACVAAAPQAREPGYTPPAQADGSGAVRPASDPPAPGLAASATSAQVRAAIDAADLAETATIDAVDALRFSDGAAAAALAAIKTGAKGDALWAATWVYATVGVDPRPLGPVLKAADASTRALAAAAVLSWGDAAGAKVLVALLRDEGRLSGSIPPSAVADYAAGSLARYVAGPKVAAGASRATVASAWKAWLAKNSSRMRYSRKTGRWTVP